ncbi:hypothetical protein LEP1GSC158_1983 [Leptospira interrogans serovar Zanoni str. LT2156]|uniref:Uncharacterized protein n=1 Tax=Leptospira interrogans serovar Zanoni str. LT2156 TaxID=1001601 RepID=M6HGX6_LEPIR|nr:hypothetical protein LEP1GSC158_1983 [Leptospira interrogans serovar Zanoni str. LT2156]
MEEPKERQAGEENAEVFCLHFDFVLRSILLCNNRTSKRNRKTNLFGLYGNISGL